MQATQEHNDRAQARDFLQQLDTAERNARDAEVVRLLEKRPSLLTNKILADNLMRRLGGNDEDLRELYGIIRRRIKKKLIAEGKLPPEPAPEVIPRRRILLED